MRRFIAVAVYLSLITFALTAPALAAEATSPLAGEVTLKGMVLNQVHTGAKEPGAFLYVLDGPGEVKAEFDRVMKECYPAAGLDADAARKLLDEFTAHLMYNIDGPLADKLRDDATYNARQVRAVTGVIHEKDGKKWITASKYEDAAYEYPAVMFAPDKPFVIPDKGPLVLTLADGLTLKCVYVPAGKFLMGEPYYMCPHWQEDPPHMVTLTKGVHMSECPITWEMYAAVTGAEMKGDSKAAANLSCADIYDFCNRLSDKTGKKVRMPTGAEWGYAARVGTSNPPFVEKYADLASDPGKAVMSGKPNAWGFYDIFGTGWERVSDSSNYIDRGDVVDPTHIPPQDSGQADKNEKHGHKAMGNSGYAIGEFEYIQNESVPAGEYPGIVRFRVVVEEPAAK